MLFLDFHLRKNTMKEIQDAIDCAGMNGPVKVFYNFKPRGS